MLAESIESCSTSPTHKDWESVLLDAGYRFAAFDGINRFYVDEGYEHLIPTLAYPISALDHFVKASMHDLKSSSIGRSRSFEKRRVRRRGCAGRSTWRKPSLRGQGTHSTSSTARKPGASAGSSREWRVPF